MWCIVKSVDICIHCKSAKIIVLNLSIITALIFNGFHNLVLHVLLVADVVFLSLKICKIGSFYKSENIQENE